MSCAKFLLSAALASALALGCAGRAPRVSSGAFVTTLGNDTVAIERYTRSDDRLEGELVTTSPRTRISRYVVGFDAQGAVTRFEVSLSEPGAAAPSASVVATVGPGAITAILHRGDRVDTGSVATGGAVFPVVLYAWGLSEIGTRALARSGRDSLAIDQYGAGARQVTQIDLVRRGDSVAMTFFGSPMMLAVDSSGRILGADGGRTTAKVKMARVDSLDVDGLAARFAARDQAGQSVGVLSPRDTVRAAVGRASLMVDYGRPAARGRQLVGGLLPLGQVWRTGANAATQFTTDRPLTFGTLAVPAATYTLWTMPTADGVQLIINRQTGQWGTEYHQDRDLGRIAMKVEPLDPPVERFTIAIESTGAGQGELRFDWANTRWVAPFRVR